MYYSTVLIFSLVLAVNLSGAQRLNSNVPPYDRTVVDIGNGSHRTNVVVLGEDGGLGNRFGTNPQPIYTQPYPHQQRPSQSPGTTVNNIGNGYGNSNTVYAQRGQPGTSHYNIGYGNNNNKVFVDGRQVVPQTQRNGAGRVVPTAYPAQPRTNAGQTTSPQITQVYVNGVPVKPDRTDASYSTYVAGGQTIHVRNTETRPTTSTSNVAVARQLYEVSKQLQQIKTRLEHEAARKNIRI
ncbi:uncharacterized protein LOC112055593 [Bicyclus anynana]|uniref:Uncharacterized protein LOC112055593 n=1 Tax=Bicyclus anynana TaxID=110368 RepID=A0A6J1NXY7_BICAN|nr:uncharacterized protein LOC112055593 [Bicyclus anynana]